MRLSNTKLSSLLVLVFIFALSATGCHLFDDLEKSGEEESLCEKACDKFNDCCPQDFPDISVCAEECEQLIVDYPEYQTTMESVPDLSCSEITCSDS